VAEYLERDGRRAPKVTYGKELVGKKARNFLGLVSIYLLLPSHTCFITADSNRCLSMTKTKEMPIWEMGD
jgi:hypothetical protein